MCTCETGSSKSCQPLFFSQKNINIKQINKVSYCISFDPINTLFYCFTLVLDRTKFISFTFSRLKLIILIANVFTSIYEYKSKLRLFSSCTTKRKQMVLKMKFVLKVQIKNMVFHFFLHNIKKKNIYCSKS